MHHLKQTSYPLHLEFRGQFCQCSIKDVDSNFKMLYQPSVTELTGIRSTSPERMSITTKLGVQHQQLGVVLSMTASHMWECELVLHVPR
jgi:hypothetical protein